MDAPSDRWRLGGTEFGVQVSCFALAALLLGGRRSWTAPRVSDPGLLFLLWAGGFLVYPSGMWLQGRTSIVGLGAGYIEIVFIAHGLFILTFMSAFLLVSGRRYWVPPNSNAELLPRGRALITVPLAILAALAVVRFLGSGTLLPESNYGESWMATQAQIGSARAGGGVGYVIAQILGKSYFYAILALGVACGLAAARALQGRRGRLRLLAGILAVVLVSQLMGVTPRSGALTVGVIALLVADLITGTVRWRHVLPAVVVAIFLFTFFGAFRQVADQGLNQGVARGYQAFSDAENQATASGEFLLMLRKDAVGAQMFDTQSDGPTHFLQGLTGMVPSQVLPGKLSSPPTDILLSRAILGPSAASSGAGVAGSAVADGFRGGGLPGVALSSILLGSLLGVVYRWLNRLSIPPANPPLLRTALVAGYLALGFSFLRGDFGLMMTLAFYNIVLPWIVFRLALTGRSAVQWLGPMPSARALTAVDRP